MTDPYINKPLSAVPYINVNERFRPKVQGKIEPNVDEEVSRIVGKKVLAHDPRLMKLIVAWKKEKPMDSMTPDNFLLDPKKIAEIKKVFSEDL